MITRIHTIALSLAIVLGALFAAGAASAADCPSTHYPCGQNSCCPK